MSWLINSRINPVKLLDSPKNVTKFCGGRRVSQSLTKNEFNVENSGEVMAASK